jgi:hypothetical protein
MLPVLHCTVGMTNKSCMANAFLANMGNLILGSP